MQESLEKQQFQGPQSMLNQNCINFQDGDYLLPNSLPSFNGSIQISPVSGIQVNNMFIPENLKQKEEEQTTHEKPELVRLVKAKSIQNNFINNLLNKTYLRKLHQLSDYQRQTLDDLIFYDSLYEKNQESLDVFTPFSRFIFIWDVSQIILYLFIFYWLPFKQSFKLNEIGELWDEKGNHSIEFFIMTILSCDVIVGMNMAFIYKGQIIRNRKKILLHYCRQYAFVDLVSLAVLTFLFYIHEDNQEIQVTQIIFVIVFYILRLNKIDKILASIYEFLNLNGSLNDLLALIQMLSIIIFIIHICACVWHGIAQLNIQPNWIDSQNIRNDSIGTRYNIALYWATMTMTTVGYGDVTARNNLETTVNIGTMLIGSIVFAYSVNSIGIFVSNIYKNKQEYTRAVTLINTFMTKNKISFDLQTRIRSYLQYIQSEEQQMNEEEVGSIVQKLSSHLQEELNQSLKGNYLKYCKIITKTFSSKFQQHLIQVMEEQKFSPEERIISLNQLDDSSIYIITKGEVEIFYEGQDQNNNIIQKNSLQRLKEGDYFGEISFITAKPRTASAKATGFVKVFKIKRESFLKTLSMFPYDYEKFCQLRDQIVMGQSVPIALKCYSCKSNQHLINECHFHHYCPDKEALLKKQLYPVEQERQYFNRRVQIKQLYPLINLGLLLKKQQQLVFSSSMSQEIESLESDENDFETSYEEDELLEDEARDSVNSLQNQFQPIEEEANKRITKIMRGSKQKTKIFFPKQDQVISQEQQNMSIIDLNSEPNKMIATFQIKPHSGDVKVSPNLSNKRITLIKKDSNYEEKQSAENLQKIGSECGYCSLLNESQKNHSQITDGLAYSEKRRNLEYEHLKIFQFYFPQNNYDIVIKKYSKVQKQFGKKKIYPEKSLYSFFFQTIKKGFKLRKLGENLIKPELKFKTIEQKKKSNRRSKLNVLFLKKQS